MSENRTVIVATDGSDHSLRVMPHAQRLAKTLGAGIDLVRVVERDDIREEGGESEDAAIERTRGRLEAESQAALKRFGTEGGVEVIVASKDEDAAQALLRAGERGVVLAMHSRGRGGIARFLSGSVALGVLKDVAQPIMLGGPELLEPPANGDTYHLLAATDLSSDADNALRVIAPLLEQGKFEVTLLYIHLHAPAGIDNEAEKARNQALLDEKRKLLPASVPVETRLREIPIGGGIDTAIMEVAYDASAQAILMATHGHSARRHLLMGSVAMSVLGRSRLPLLVARAQA